MPYIDKSARDEIDPELRALLSKIARVADSHATDVDGTVNYVITSILHTFFTGKYVRYERAIGCLECAKLEFYRRAVAPYEDEKMKESGDVT